MTAFGLTCSSHAIPRQMKPGSSAMCAVRVRNDAGHDLHFQSHASFYGTPVAAPRHHLSVHIDGVLAKPLLVHRDRLAAGESAALFFPFHAGEAADHRVEVVIAEQHADPVLRKGATLLETRLRVGPDRTGAGLVDRLRRGAFMLRHAEWPARLKARERRACARQLTQWSGEEADRMILLGRYKAINEELAFMEKQVRRRRVVSLPSYLAIDTTSKCNLDCKMCFRTFTDVDFNEKADLPVELLDRFIDELFPTAMTLNLSSLGEPLMSPYLDKLLDACSKHLVYLSITTNGTTFRGDDWIKRLAAVLHHIEYSVDSLQPERFKSFRSGASLRKVLDNAGKLGAIRRGLPDPRFNLGFSMTLFRENLDEVPDMLRTVADVGGNFLKADIGVIFDKRDLSQSVLGCPERYNDMYALAQEQARAAGLNLMMRAPFGESDTKPVKYGLCDYLYLSACIRSEGTLSPCYFGPALIDVKGKFATAWNSHAMRQLRTDHDTARAHDLCKSCYVFTDGGSGVEHRKTQFLKGDAL